MKRSTYYLLTVLIAVIVNTNLFAQDEWLGWDWQRKVTVSSSSALTDYPVKIVLDTLGSFPFDFNHAKNDGSDLRITESDAITEIPYWIEEWNKPGKHATIWTKVDNISTGGDSIFLYYGNPVASSMSNGLETFEFYDDFETWNYDKGWRIKDTLPHGVADQTAVVFRDSVYYSIGGYGTSPSDTLNDNHEYNPATDNWTTKANMPTARWGMVAVEFNDLIYVFGGFNGLGSDKNEVYNPITNTWTTKAELPPNLANHGIMGVKVDNKIHLFLNQYHYVYDPALDTFTQMLKDTIPTHRKWGTCALVDNKIYIIGGNILSGMPQVVNEVFDLADSTWSTKAPLPQALYGITRENPVIDGKIFVAHGKEAGPVFYNTNYMYDPAADTWEKKGSAFYPRDGAGCAVINNILYVVGGRDTSDAATHGLVYHEVYDPLLDTYVSNSGDELWEPLSFSPGDVFADTSAKYSGNYGLTIFQSETGAGGKQIETDQTFTNPFALDFNWKTLLDGSMTTPQYYVLPIGTFGDGELWFYDDPFPLDGTAELRWKFASGVFDSLAISAWNTWHKVTIQWNPPSATNVIFDGGTSQTYGSSAGTGVIQFGSFFAAKQYLDNVRVRKWTGTDPVTTPGAEKINPLPVELVSFTAKISDSFVKLNWKTATEVSNYGFDILRMDENNVWENIGFVQGNGNSNSPKEYSFTDNNVNSGKYSYRLKQIDTDGSFAYSQIVEVNFGAPKNFELAQNYPNPFNPSTKITVSLPVKTSMKLAVFNILGEVVKVVTESDYEAGKYEFTFDAIGLASGLYFYRVETP
ncbi:MAG: DUF2341 domain-containing protein, partial [Ignavibacteriales bacterium]